MPLAYSRCHETPADTSRFVPRIACGNQPFIIDILLLNSLFEFPLWVLSLSSLRVLTSFISFFLSAATTTQPFRNEDNTFVNKIYRQFNAFAFVYTIRIEVEPSDSQEVIHEKRFTQWSPGKWSVWLRRVTREGAWVSAAKETVLLSCLPATPHYLQCRLYTVDSTYCLHTKCKRDSLLETCFDLKLLNFLNFQIKQVVCKRLNSSLF